ncbi:MAG: beta-ketoacyl-[acyl-carrier-protein] synthase family protein [Acidobacteriota bacterium]
MTRIPSVVVTGVGIVSCLGTGAAANREAVIAGRSGIRRIEHLDIEQLDCRIAGEVGSLPPGAPPAGQDRFTRLALIAADEAGEQARFSDSGIEPERLGTIIGTGMGGCETLDAGYERLYGRGLTRLPPNLIPSSMYNAATSAVAARIGARGPAFSIVSACASSAHAIGQARDWIVSGRASMVVCGGSDAPLTIGTIRAWESLRVLAIENDHPERACRPFSADRIGLVLSEGAAVFVLESADFAAARGQKPLAEIIGFGMTSDAGHITDPSADGNARAMSMALSESGLSPGDVTYINAHGTATRANDLTETAAIKSVFGQNTAIPVSSTKSSHGHAMGASGAIELALTILSLREGMIPPTLNLTVADPACDLDYVPLQARPANVEHFLSNSFGFGGMNAVLAVRIV